MTRVVRLGCILIASTLVGSCFSPDPVTQRSIYETTLMVPVMGVEGWGRMIVGITVPRDEMVKRMQSRCQQAGMRLDESVVHISPGALKGPNSRTYRYYCRAVAHSQPPSEPLPKELPRIDSTGGSNIDVARKKCEELGLKSGTEKFGECVLRLSK